MIVKKEEIIGELKLEVKELQVKKEQNSLLPNCYVLEQLLQHPTVQRHSLNSESPRWKLLGLLAKGFLVAGDERYKFIWCKQALAGSQYHVVRVCM